MAAQHDAPATTKGAAKGRAAPLPA